MSNTVLIDFFNKYPWYDWVAILIVLSLMVGILYIVNHYGIIPGVEK